MISYSYNNILVLISNCRQEKKTNPQIEVKDFSWKTGSTVCRNHLVDRHLGTWVVVCDKLRLPIVAPAVQTAVNNYRQRQGTYHMDDGTPQSRPFTQEAFVDAIMEFIIADDQVSLLNCF